VQGTVKSYDEATRTGSLLTDDRTEIPIDDRSFGDPSLRFLRIGQRVRFELDDGGVARSLLLVTF
jgi:2-phospho-L-lactate guanylyltransferase